MGILPIVWTCTGHELKGGGETTGSVASNPRLEGSIIVERSEGTFDWVEPDRGSVCPKFSDAARTPC